MSRFRYYISSTGNRDIYIGPNNQEVFVNAAGDWVVTGFRVGEPTVINGLRYTIHKTVGSGVAMAGLVGISTSLGPNGLFPYEISNILQNVTPGTAKTVGFFYQVSANFDSSSVGESNFRYATGSQTTLFPGIQYYAGIYISSVGTAGTIYFRASPTGDNYNTFHAETLIDTWQRSTGSSTTNFNGKLNIVPYYSVGSGYSYYPIVQPNFVELSDNAFWPKEPGFFFELNDFGVQDAELVAITLEKWRLYKNNASLWPILYDGYNTLQVIAIGITDYLRNVTFNVPYGSPEAFESNYKLYFAPPVKIRPDYKYFVGIGISLGVNTDGQDNIQYTWIDDAMCEHRFRMGFRAAAGFPATESPLYAPIVLLHLNDTFGINRSIGN